LSRSFVDESSGLAVSSDGRRLYHINDSGDGNSVYVSDNKAGQLRRVKLKKTKARDVEDLAIAPCPSQLKSASRECLFVADIGDNKEKRKSISIRIYPEPEASDDEVELLLEQEITYPDRPHNAEAFAVDVSGDWYVLTKEDDGKLSAKAAQLFRLSASGIGQGPARLEQVREIDIPTLTGLSGLDGLVTAMDLDPSGTTLVVLTYGGITEFLWSSVKDAGRSLQAGRDFRRLPVQVLTQQEAVAYNRGGAAGVFYTSEAVLTEGPLMALWCR
jgi:hypothetical protein